MIEGSGFGAGYWSIPLTSYPNPDLGGPKTCGSGGSGSGTLVTGSIPYLVSCRDAGEPQSVVVHLELVHAIHVRDLEHNPTIQASTSIFLCPYTQILWLPFLYKKKSARPQSCESPLKIPRHLVRLLAIRILIAKAAMKFIAPYG
jgi:hypothetical protein